MTLYFLGTVWAPVALFTKDEGASFISVWFLGLGFFADRLERALQKLGDEL